MKTINTWKLFSCISACSSWNNTLKSEDIQIRIGSIEFNLRKNDVVPVRPMVFFCQGPKIQSKILCLRDSLGVSLGDHGQTICLKNTFFETTIEKLFSSWDGFETPTVEKSLYRRFSGVPSFSKLFLYYLRNWVSFLTWARWNTREIAYKLQLIPICLALSKYF